MSDPILPPVICQKIKGYTYVRTYKNVRVDGKKYPVKVNVVTIAEINKALVKKVGIINNSPYFLHD